MIIDYCKLITLLTKYCEYYSILHVCTYIYIHTCIHLILSIVLNGEVQVWKTYGRNSQWAQ